MGTGKHSRYLELLNLTENIIQKNALCFTDICLTPVKAVFNLECEILQQLFKALTELQRLQFLPSLALIHGAHTRLNAWEGRIQKEVQNTFLFFNNTKLVNELSQSWKLGFLKNNPSPALLQWLLKLKGIVLSKFSLYFHNTLAQQTTPNDMRNICMKLQHDYYQK